MSREDDVMVVGSVVEMLRQENAHDAAVYHVEVVEQDGEHASGRRALVTARSVEARMARRMREAGVQVRAGDRVALLINPVPNRHVCTIIRIVSHAKAKAAP